MDIITLVGIGIYMAGHGVRGIPEGGLLGSVSMIIGGALVIISALI